MAALVRNALTNFHPNYHRQPAAPGLLQRLEGTLRLWQRRLRERGELAAFSYRDMRDIGLTPSEVRDEIRAPFWRSAVHR